MQAVVFDAKVAKYYTNSRGTNGNSGFDLYVHEDVTFLPNQLTMVDFGIAMKTDNGSGFWLLPRSSMGKTPLRLANSVGLIDPGYRGNLIGAIYNHSNDKIIIPAGTRLLQVALPSLMPFDVRWVRSLDETSRGAGGFGSTGGTFNDVNYTM